MIKQTVKKAIYGLTAFFCGLLILGPASVTVQAEDFSTANYQVLGNIIGGVESGGQVYGQKDYGAYAGAHAISAKEVTCTLGWPQYYGNEAQELIQKIYSKNPTSFRKIDSKGLIEARLKTNWVDTQWDPNDDERDVLIQLINSSEGRAAQDEMFTEVVRPMVQECEKTYTKNPKSVAMYAEIRHLGGQAPVDRIFERSKTTYGDYTVEHILASLKADQKDTSNSNQVGDSLYWSRHEKCAEWVNKYIVDNGKETDEVVSPLYRLYNKSNGEHLYTKNLKERNYLTGQGWKYEGVAWYVPQKSSSPVYRVFNPNTGEHFYTTATRERDYLVKQGWKNEGIGWYSDAEKKVPVYREFNPNASTGTHNYTTSQRENAYLVSSGWKAEGVAWYGAEA